MKAAYRLIYKAVTGTVAIRHGWVCRLTHAEALRLRPERSRGDRQERRSGAKRVLVDCNVHSCTDVS